MALYRSPLAVTLWPSSFLKNSLAEIVEVEMEVVSPSIVPSGSFTELKSHCHLYGAQGQRQAYLLPMPRLRGPRSDYVRQWPARSLGLDTPAINGDIPLGDALSKQLNLIEPQSLHVVRLRNGGGGTLIPIWSSEIDKIHEP
ncbi:hypothetical protein TNCV_3055061 [Trichonephila clavipes]|nr:hypothetical protein TNCV_3055061 [Trichonephila clavipes]